MAYNGSVELISGIKPKNNGSFPMVHARDVYVDDNTRLDNKLSAIQENETNIQNRADAAYNAVSLGLQNAGDAILMIEGNTLILVIQGGGEQGLYTFGASTFGTAVFGGGNA